MRMTFSKGAYHAPRAITVSTLSVNHSRIMGPFGCVSAR
jgi:hypothetical protein